MHAHNPSIWEAEAGEVNRFLLSKQNKTNKPRSSRLKQHEGKLTYLSLSDPRTKTNPRRHHLRISGLGDRVHRKKSSLQTRHRSELPQRPAFPACLASLPLPMNLKNQ